MGSPQPYDAGTPSWVRFTPGIDGHTVTGDWSTDFSTWHALGSVSFPTSNTVVEIVVGAGLAGIASTNPGEALIDTFNVCP